MGNDSEKLIGDPSFWRLLGLLVSDGEASPRYDEKTTFANTNEVLSVFFENVVRSFNCGAYHKNLKKDKRPNRKPLWRISTKGEIRKFIIATMRTLIFHLKNINDACFWQFITGLYEGDGTITFRPGKIYKGYTKNYLEMEIKLSKNELKIANVIQERLLNFGIKSCIKTQENYVRFRISSIYGIKSFFVKSEPLIKNPNDAGSFIDTRTKNCRTITELFSSLDAKFQKNDVLISKDKFVDFRKFNKFVK